MFILKILDRISEVGLSQFPNSRYLISPDETKPHALLLRSHKLHNDIIPASVSVVGRAGIGTDNIPVEILTKQGIPVLYTPGANANAVKELVIAALLMGSRQLEKASEFMRSLKTEDNTELNYQIETNKKKFVGHEIQGKTLGVIGLGNIGVKVANDALALGMHVVGFDPVMTIENALALSPGVKKVNNVDELLSTADFISMHIPLNDKTKQFMNTTRLGLLKDNTILLNFSRAGVVDDEAILNALSIKKLGGYITDFPSVTLKGHPQVICMPHLGASTFEAEENCAKILCKNIRDFLENGTIKDSVNFPDTNLPWLPLENQTRLAITNSNIPGAIAAISQAISQAGLNINQMVNHSSHTIAYNLIDVTGQPNIDMLGVCEHLPGILQTRLIIKDV